MSLATGPKRRRALLTPVGLLRDRDAIRNVHPSEAETWVWEADGRVVGFLCLLGNEVGAVFVDPRCQRSGIGSALVDHARALRGELEVEVFRDNPVGRAFCAKYGFEPMLERVHEPTGRILLRLRLAAGAPQRPERSSPPGGTG